MNDREYERTILQKIDKHGWFCSTVFDPKGKLPSFCYSVGFTQTLKAPEFIVFGLDDELMHAMLWQVFRDISSGRQPEDMQRWGGLLHGCDCVVRTVHPTNVVIEYLNSAIWFWRRLSEHRPLPVFQLVWPGSKSGLFPWDDGCPQSLRDGQPALYLPNAGYH